MQVQRFIQCNILRTFLPEYLEQVVELSVDVPADVDHSVLGYLNSSRALSLVPVSLSLNPLLLRLSP